MPHGEYEPNRIFTFPTRAEAEAFDQGVEWVNDSAIEHLGVREEEDGQFSAIYHDKDATDNWLTDEDDETDSQT